MASDSSLTPDLVQHQSFTSGFRGYDQAEVRSFLNRVAAELRQLRERTEQLESAWRSAEERAARPPVLDEDTLMAAVGEETASILRSARAAASDMRTRAGDDAEKVVAEAREQAAKALEEAKEQAARESQAAEESAAGVVAAARAEAAEMIEKSHAEATSLLDRTRAETSEAVVKATAEADTIRGQAEKERQLTIEGANTTRDRILEDLSRRRRVATVQIEQLRAGRERLIESYAVVRRTLEEAQSELSRADAEARAAADEVGRRLRGEPDGEPGPGGEPSPQAAIASVVDITSAAVPEPGSTPGSPEEPEGGGTQKVRVRKRSAGRNGTTEGQAAGTSKVDELFARIRATRTDSTEPDGADEIETAEGLETPEEPETAEEPETVTETAVDETGEAPDSELSEADETLLQERESVVVDLEVTLTRRLKRALQDEQNDLLDRLRNLRVEPTMATLLPGEEEQIARYSGTARSLLDQAAAAGADFTHRLLSDPNGVLSDPKGQTANGSAKVPHGRSKSGNRVGNRDGQPGLDDLALEAGTTIVSALRRGLEHAIDVSAGDDQGVLIESVGSAYREWKTQRIERLAGDMLAAAFSRGTWEAAPEGTPMRWIVEDTDGPCPDCDDDALAGELPKGEAFPTGQHHPPAHTGCRCLLVPAAG